MTKLATDYLKEVDCIEKLKELMVKSPCGFSSGIGHTRWATCGEKSDKNAHPHLDMRGRVGLVHNGTLDNLKQMREDLANKGIVLTSQTDSELIAQYLGHYLD